jgi:hypothetical protein
MPRTLPVVLMAALLSVAPPSAVRAASNLTPSQIEHLLTAPNRRVRSDDARIKKLLADGLRKSATFGDLVSALNRTDVIVYIQASTTLPATLDGRLLLAVGPQRQRYLRVQIRLNLPANELIALIGHELRHAIEIGESPEVVDEGSMIRLYERIGERGDRCNHYDTIAARETGRRVRTEL